MSEGTMGAGSLEIYFDHNSAAITSKAKPTLSSLGKALQAS